MKTHKKLVTFTISTTVEMEIPDIIHSARQADNHRKIFDFVGEDAIRNALAETYPEVTDISDIE